MDLNLYQEGSGRLKVLLISINSLLLMILLSCGEVESNKTSKPPITSVVEVDAGSSTPTSPIPQDEIEDDIEDTEGQKQWLSLFNNILTEKEKNLNQGQVEQKQVVSQTSPESPEPPAQTKVPETAYDPGTALNLENIKNPTTQKIVFDKDGKDKHRNVEISGVIHTEEKKTLILYVGPSEAGEKSKTGGHQLFPRIAMTKNYDSGAEVNNTNKPCTSSCSKTGKNLWGVAKNCALNEKVKPCSENMYVSFVSNPLSSCSFDHKKARKVYLDSMDLRIKNTSLLRGNKKDNTCQGTQVNECIDLYKRPDKGPIWKSNSERACNIEQGNCHEATAAFKGFKPKWTKDKKWREVKLNFDQEVMEHVLDKNVEINGITQSYRAHIIELRKQIRDENGEKIKLSKEDKETRDLAKEEVSMKLLAEILRLSKFHANLTVKDRTNKDNILKLEGIADIDATAIQVEEGEGENKVKKWKLALQTKPFKYKQ